MASNVSTTLEVALALQKGYPVEHVFTFSSENMPVLAVCLSSAQIPVHLFMGGKPSPFSGEHLRVLDLLKCELRVHSKGAEPVARASAKPPIIVATEDAIEQGHIALDDVDAVVGKSVLFIRNAKRISPADILVRRKRMSTPMTTFVAVARLRELARMPPQPMPAPDATGLAELMGHMQTLSGVAVDPASNPVWFTAGLPTLASLWTYLIGTGGGVDVVMASTAYGGSSQLVDLLCHQTPAIRKYTFDLQGHRGMEESIRGTLEGMAKHTDTLHLITVLFIETPSNPDMKVPDLTQVAEILRSYHASTKRQIILLVDTTFAPASGVLRQVREVAPELNALVFCSVSKAVSRGKTVGGVLVFNGSDAAAKIRTGVLCARDMFDTGARPDQIATLIENHTGVEARCQNAYAIAASVGAALVEAVKAITGKDMVLEFVSPQVAKRGFTTPTFSFNLPPLEGAAPGVNEGLAQRFVDLITAHHTWFKPCVSFGQDNSLIYCTVPATSTQGAIKEEDKAKQALGGVQLVRLSFPPTVDVDAVKGVIAEALKTIYTMNA